MGNVKFALKLFGTHALMTVVQFFLYLILFSIFVENQIYQWFMGIFFIFLFWVVLYADVSYAGQNDIKRGVYNPAKGFISGLYTAIPGILLYIGSLIYLPITILLRLWQIPYMKVFISFEEAMPHLALVAVLLFPIGTGLSYLDGPRRRNKILKSIEKSDALRAEKSKRDK